MTQDEIIEMAKQAEMKSFDLFKLTVAHMSIEQLHIFAKLVAAKATASEREACAKVCEALRETIWEYHEEHLKAAACNVCTNLAIAIRARGET